MGGSHGAFDGALTAAGLPCRVVTGPWWGCGGAVAGLWGGLWRRGSNGALTKPGSGWGFDGATTRPFDGGLYVACT